MTFPSLSCFTGLFGLRVWRPKSIERRTMMHNDDSPWNAPVAVRKGDLVEDEMDKMKRRRWTWAQYGPFCFLFALFLFPLLVCFFSLNLYRHVFLFSFFVELSLRLPSEPKKQ